MENEDKRFIDLARRSYEKGVAVYTEFLSEAGQSALLSLKLDIKPVLWGGFAGAERRIAIFGAGAEQAPVRLMKIEPVSQKFAPKLCHRDFLGAALALGVKREMIGDIIVFENTGYLFCKDTVFEYICENLESVGRAKVRCAEIKCLPQGAGPKMQRENVMVSSKRLDSVIGAVYNLPRGRAKDLFNEKKVFLNSAEERSPAYVLKSGDVISVRGHGKFIFEVQEGTTKKGRLILSINRYI
ncbi:MAG: YlmH/Sll1252 family protein [Clostridiales bacterium]|nr:YlmH/Sll1252 family protein [Clostridiales bacterium]